MKEGGKAGVVGKGGDHLATRETFTEANTKQMGG